MWPFSKRENRASSYSDAILQTILAQATGEPGNIGGTGALEIASGVVARAFGAAVIEDAPGNMPELTPTDLMTIGRRLIAEGECVFLVDHDKWHEVADWEVHGTAVNPRMWRYRVEVPTPDDQKPRTLPGVKILHPKYSYDRRRPWVGIPPLQRADLLSTLHASLEQQTGREAGGTVGHLLPIPTDSNDASVAALKEDLQNLKGRTALVETTAAGWGEGRGSAPRADWMPQRIGANYPQSIPQMLTHSQLSVLAACGVPVELVSQSDGTGMREAWRRFLHGTVAPLGKILEGELRKMYGGKAKVSFESLFASDIQGRARAFQSLAGGGMDLEKAAALSGLLIGD